MAVIVHMNRISLPKANRMLYRLIRVVIICWLFFSGAYAQEKSHSFPALIPLPVEQLQTNATFHINSSTYIVCKNPSLDKLIGLLNFYIAAYTGRQLPVAPTITNDNFISVILDSSKVTYAEGYQLL